MYAQGQCSHSHFDVVLKDMDLRVESIRKGSHLKQQISDAEVCDVLNVNRCVKGIHGMGRNVS